ncbi:uncharacterized protein PHACADRAFT_204159 [Phanerochaete carnosa HHB-10118-sp]|uniref:Uncharacterized protein n=1 Tax=Phanerochaete carnosa (strain HHB-10118-sp) TaxID=650164 RepID=K5VDF5_PHACS|nr:uncharacterized protein PHACADRAFT_204159 [Phanerochaete carnosa HHB-10118-sp]EKM61011.1 hypothetical protein PHACADRAFT_204159 [Phanerochaete carnosa HHB-10118-sp]
MNPYHSPQPGNPASLGISSPRSLRPREQLHASAPRYHPSIPQALYSPSHVPESVADRDQEAHYHDPPALHEEETSMEGTPDSRGRFMGGLVNRLRRISGAFSKHHSRESLYSEYLAEAQAMVSQDGRFPTRVTSQALSEIPETSAELDSEPQPTDDGDDARTMYPSRFEIVRSDGTPTYMDSEASSEHSKAESIHIPLPPPDTWEYYRVLIIIFFLRIWRLPWSSHRIVRDYVPARDGRARKAGHQKVVESWYKPKNRKDDMEKPNISPPHLLIVPATPQPGSILSGAYSSALPQPVVIPSPYSEATTAIRPMRTPGTVTSAGMNLPSPGMSSHGQGYQSVRYSWYSSSPQHYPWQYPFQSSFTSPQTYIDTPASGYLSPR